MENFEDLLGESLASYMWFTKKETVQEMEATLFKDRYYFSGISRVWKMFSSQNVATSRTIGVA